MEERLDIIYDVLGCLQFSKILVFWGVVVFKNRCPRKGFKVSSNISLNIHVKSNLIVDSVATSNNPMFL